MKQPVWQGLQESMTNWGAVGTYGQNLWGDLDAGTDICVYNRSYGIDNVQVSTYNYNNTDASIETTWKDLYEGHQPGE